MEIYGDLWRFMEIYDDLWSLMEFYGDLHTRKYLKEVTKPMGFTHLT